MSKDISSHESNADLSIAWGIGWGDWKHLETLSAQHGVGQEGSGNTPLGSDKD